VFQTEEEKEGHDCRRSSEVRLIHCQFCSRVFLKDKTYHEVAVLSGPVLKGKAQYG
jgi:hypothetical protein